MADDVTVVGTLGMVLEVGVVWLVLSGHRLARQAAVAVGSSLAAGYVVVHLLPKREWLSDSIVSGGGAGVTWFSWVAVLLLLGAALLLATAGWYALDSQPTQAANTSGAPRPGARHAAPTPHRLDPITAALLLGNAVIFVGSLATR